MHEMTGHALTVFMGFFAIMNPVANTPIFLGLTADDPPEIRRRVAAKVLLFTFMLIVIFSLLGKIIFDVFGITLPAFQITGAIKLAG
jgi:multiple antibiotic resistance protein